MNTMNEKFSVFFRRPSVVVILAIGLSGCLEGDQWEGFVYPNQDNLMQHREVGTYSTLEECRSAALAVIELTGWRADYECGLNCESSNMTDLRVCERTER